MKSKDYDRRVQETEDTFYPWFMFWYRAPIVIIQGLILGLKK